MGISLKLRKYNALRRPYVWLLIISILIGLILLFNSRGPFVWLPNYVPRIPYLSTNQQQLLSSLGVGIFSSYLTTVLIDGTFREREERERRQLQNTALTELSTPLNKYLKLLRIWYRTSLDEVPNSPSDSLIEVIEKKEIETIRMLDFSESYPVLGGPRDYTFLIHSANQIEEIQESVDEVIQKYGPFLNPELINELQKLKNSEVFSTIKSQRDYKLWSSKDVLALFAEDLYVEFEKDMNSLLEVVSFYQEPNSPELNLIDISGMWIDDEKPKIGSARIDIPFSRVKKIELSDSPPYTIWSGKVQEIIDEQQRKEDIE